MEIIELQNTQSVVNSYLAELRDVNVQTDPMRFRRNIERIGSLMAYEVSKHLDYAERDITTPLGISKMSLPTDNIVVGTILRAGLPMHNGLLEIFDRAENCFISAYRKYSSLTDFDIELEYVATPSLEGKTLLLADPMLATGMSLAKTIVALRRYGTPKHLHVMSIISCPEGIDYLKRALEGCNVTLWIAAIDAYLNDHKYIVPGLGDAGDLAFGAKL
jgi:uracil phosphoribosyltransferase